MTSKKASYKTRATAQVVGLALVILKCVFTKGFNFKVWTIASASYRIEIEVAHPKFI